MSFFFFKLVCSSEQRWNVGYCNYVGLFLDPYWLLTGGGKRKGLEGLTGVTGE